MGFLERYARHALRPAKPRRPSPSPPRAMATVGGVTHRLTWMDRHAGYRMRCSCGWMDYKLRSSERAAILAGNAHVQSVRAAMAEQRRQIELNKPAAQRQAELRRRRIWVFGLVTCVSVVAAVVVIITVASQSSYKDGYHWGQAQTVGIVVKTAPSCLRAEMVSNTQVSDPAFLYNKPDGDDRPNDNFAQWQAGCEAGAQATIQQFNGNTGGSG